LADNAEYETATIVEPQIPRRWSDTEIEIVVNRGRLPEDKPAHLFVFTQQNHRNRCGLAIGKQSVDTLRPAR